MSTTQFYSCGKKRHLSDAEKLGPSFSCECGRVHFTIAQNQVSHVAHENETAVAENTPTVKTGKFKLLLVRLNVEIGIWKIGLMRIWERLFGTHVQRIAPYGKPQEAKEHSVNGFVKAETTEPTSPTGFEQLALSELPSKKKLLRYKLLRMLEGNEERLGDLMRYYRKRFPDMKEEDRIDKAIIDLERDLR